MHSSQAWVKVLSINVALGRFLKARSGAVPATALAVLIILGAIFAMWSTRHSLETLHSLEHSQFVRLEISRVVMKVIEVETAVRGFSLSGGEAFLERYDADVASAFRSLERLQQLTRDDMQQHQRAEKMAPLIKRKAEIFQEQTGIRREQGSSSAILKLSEEGKQLTDELRRLADEMDAAEQRLLNTRTSEARNASRTAVTAVLAGSSGALMLVGLAAWVIRREVESRRAAASVQEHARAYAEAIVNTIRDPLLVLDHELRIERANRSFEEVFGASAAESSGRLVADLDGEVWREPRLHEALQETLHGSGRFDDLELTGDVPGFGCRTLLLSGRRLERGSGKPAALLLALQDISDRKRAEAELRRSSEENYDLYNHAPCGYHSVDREGRIARMNDTELRWLGYRREEVVGEMKFADLLTPHSRKLFELIEPRFESEGFVRGFEIEMVRKNGTRMVVLLNSVAGGDAQGEYIGSRSTIFDITDRKQVEEKVHQLNVELHQRAAELEASNEELEAFSYSVSHDLRAPVRHIDGFADLLARHSGASLDSTGQRFLRNISESAKRMGTLIDDLLVFSQMGRTEMRRSIVDLEALVDETISEMQRDTVGREIVWKRQPLPSVQGDVALLRQVFVNLLSNAVKYTRTREQALIEVGCFPDGDSVAVFVRDNGVGFEMAYVDKLFGVFQRLHRANEFEGTGIGLANVRRVVSRHGGRTWAEGRVGEGATFFFSLPLASGEIVQSIPDAAEN